MAPGGGDNPGKLRVRVSHEEYSGQTRLTPGQIAPYFAPGDTNVLLGHVVFGLFWLLGYRFSPRIADMGNSRLWRIDPKADYSPLNSVSPHRINAI
jgi:hypothetical protein